MPDVYDSVITRANATALIPEDVSRQIIQSLPGRSVVMSRARKMPNMTRGQQRIPVLSLLPTAYFVTGDTGMKQTTGLAWENQYFNAEELAVILPISEAVLSDADYDIWGEARPRIEEAMGRALDQAVLFGTNAPSSWPDDILTGAGSASHTVAYGTGADVYEDLLGPGGCFDLVDNDGFEVNGCVATRSMKAILRGLRDANGQPLFNRVITDRTRYELDGVPCDFPTNGGMLPASALMVVGDWNQLLWTIREDISFKLFREGVISDGQGAIVHNLMQQDMVAMRVTFRVAWALPNPINSLATDAATRYPFSILTPAA
jgi:HK97 family phage major capsid protein